MLDYLMWQFFYFFVFWQFPVGNVLYMYRQSHQINEKENENDGRSKDAVRVRR